MASVRFQRATTALAGLRARSRLDEVARATQLDYCIMPREFESRELVSLAHYLKHMRCPNIRLSVRLLPFLRFLFPVYIFIPSFHPQCDSKMKSG